MSSEERILAAATRLLSERGFAGAAMDAVALAADVPQTELYSVYRSRSELLAGLLRHHSHTHGSPQPPSTGELRDDLVGVVAGLLEAIRERRVLIAIACAEAPRDQELRRELRLFLRSWQEPAQDLLSRAVQERLLPPPLRAESAAETLSAIVWFRVVVAGQLEVEGVVEQLADRLLSGWRVE